MPARSNPTLRIPPLVLAVLVLALAAPDALATHQIGMVTLSVATQGPGTVTGDFDDGISCGSDCQETYTLDEDCNPADGGGNHAQGRVQCDTIYPDVRLFASGTNGFALDRWSGGGCTGSTACLPFVNGKPTRVTATFVDVEAPVMSLNGPAAGSEIGGASFEFTASPTDNDLVASVEYRIDGQTVATSSQSPYRVPVDMHRRPDNSVIANGSAVSITAIARDRAGNADPVTRSYFVDNAVSARFSQLPDDFTSAPSPELHFTSDDGDVTGYKCTALRGGVTIAGPAGCTSPYRPPVAQDGTYEVRVQPTDDQGNTTTISDAFVIDRTNPVVSLTGPAEGAALSGGFTPAFTIVEANGNPSETKCRLDAGGQFVPCGPVATPPDGDHAFTVRAVDKAGNVGEDTNSFVIDTAAPQLDIVAGPAENEIIAVSTAAFSFLATDPHGPIRYSCAVDGGALGDCSGAASHDLPNLPDGPHTFAVRAQDAALNARAVQRQFVVNAVRPTVEIVGGLPDGAATAADALVFSFLAAGGEVACSLDSAAVFRPCSGADSDALAGLGEGQHTFRVRVRDESNDQVLAARSFRVDRSRPETTIDAGPAEGSLTQGRAVTFSFSSGPGSTFMCRVGRLGKLGAFGPCSGPGNTHSARRLAPGRYRFEVLAVNALGLGDLTPARRSFRLTRSFKINVANVWQLRGNKTAVLDLAVKRVPRRGAVNVSCRGGGCAFKRRTAKVRKGAAKLTRLFEQRSLSEGAIVEIRVSAPGAITRIARFELRSGEFPKRRDLCLPPGAAKPGAC